MVSDLGAHVLSSRLMALEHHWSKCIVLEGNYLEKEEIDLDRKLARLVSYFSLSYFMYVKVSIKTMLVYYLVCFCTLVVTFANTIVPDQTVLFVVCLQPTQFSHDEATRSI